MPIYSFGYDKWDSWSGDRTNPGDDLRIVLPDGIDPQDVIVLGRAAGVSRIDVSYDADGVYSIDYGLE